MGAAILVGNYLATNNCIGAAFHIPQTIFCAGNRNVGELIHIPSGLEAVVLEHPEHCLLRKHRQIKNSGFQHHIVGQVLLIHCNQNTGRHIRDLHRSIDNATVVFAVFLGGQHKQTVAELK